MFKVTVLNVKRSSKFFRYLTFFLVLIIILSIIYYFRTNLKENEDVKGFNISFLSCLNDTIPGIKLSKNDNKKEQNNEKNIFKTLLYAEIPVMNKSFIISNIPNDSKLSDDENSIKNLPEKPIEFAKENVSTSLIESNVPNNYTDEFSGVEIKNSTDYELKPEDFSSNLDINKEDIIIFHTHTCESYTPTEEYEYEASGDFRTLDLERNVAKVGSVLEKYLNSYNYKVLHDTTYHDYPAYSGSYGRSMATVETLLKSKPNTDMILDIHRDAIADETYAPSVKIGDEVVSRLMFVIGTDGGGLEHPNWRENLKFAIKVQEKANEMYPGLFRPIIVRNSRYNEHLGKAACIIEVGATGNTLEQSMGSMKYLSKVIDETLKSY